MRWGQLNLNERDAQELDVAWWVDYWKQCRVDGLMISAGGISAFYPSRVPLHYRSPYLKDRDLFGEYARAAKAAGLRVVARLDPMQADVSVYRAHPDWFLTDAEGRPSISSEARSLYRTCIHTPYFDQHMTAIIREINERYDVDGFFTNAFPNAVDWMSICRCPHCERRFRERAGAALPARASLTDPSWRRYTEFVEDRALEIWQLWDRTAKEKKPDSLYIGNLGGGLRARTPLMRIAKICSWLNADHQGRSNYVPLWDGGQQGRICYAVMRGKSATMVNAAWTATTPRWRHIAKPHGEQQLWMAQTVASGMKPWWHWLGSRPRDKRWMNWGRDYLRWLAEHENHFRNQRSLSEIALVWSQRTLNFYGLDGESAGRRLGNDPGQSLDFFQGMYFALLENRLPFDLVHEDDLSEERLKQYRVLVLPNVALLGDAQCANLGRYARAGGSLVATFETSLYNEWGDLRKDFGLAEVFGVHFDGQTEGPLPHSYMNIERGHEILNGLEGTEHLPSGEMLVRLTGAAGHEAPVLTHIPPYPAYPPEKVYTETPRTDRPALFLRKTPAGGRVAYFPGDLDRIFWRSLAADLSRLLGNSVVWALGRPPQVRLEGKGLVDIFLWENQEGLALHIVNLSAPGMFKGPVREILPLGPLQVSWQLPAGALFTGVRLLRSGARVSAIRRGNVIEFTIPRLEDYEVAAV